MIRQSFKVQGYWEVIVFYDIDYDLFSYIADELYAIGASKEIVDGIYETMYSGKAYAFTFSNPKRHISIVGFNKHNTCKSYLNSIVHEAEHVKQAMLYAYNVGDSGEPPAHTIGYLIEKMYPVFKDIIY